MSLNAAAFWKPNIPELVEQWDIFADVPFSMPLASSYLNKVSGPKNLTTYGVYPTPQKSKDNRFLGMAELKMAPGMLLNYECDWDKSKSATLAAVFPIAHVPAQNRDNVIAGSMKSQLFLPNLPTMGDAVVDLRSIHTFRKETIEKLQRLASLSQEAKNLARAHMAAYFFRVQWPDDLKPPPF